MLRLIAYVGILAAGAAALVWMPTGRVSARGRETLLINEFGAGASITQGFENPADGLRAIRIQLTSERGADVTFGYRLSLGKPGEAIFEVRRSTQIVTGLRGTREVTLEFPAITHSGGMWCLLELHAIDVRALDGSARPDAALVATRDMQLRPALLKVGERERWGALVFSTRADADTALGRFRLDASDRVSAFVREPWFLVAVLALYAALILPLGATLLQSQTRPEPPARSRRGRGLAVCAVMIAALGSSVWIARAERGAVNLIDDIHHADIKSLALLRFVEVVPVEIDVGETRAIFAHAPTEATWRLVPPAGAHLETAVTLSPGVWDQEGNGVIFRVRVRDGAETAELFSRHVDTFHVPSDRHWLPVDIDLARFAGRPVDLTLVTDPDVDPGHDWALWREPRVVTRGMR